MLLPSGAVIVPRSVRIQAAATLVALLALGSCLPSEPTGSRPRPAETTLLVQADLSGTTVATVVVEVTAPDIPATLVFNIPVNDRVALGTITLPAGSNRTITMRAYDAGGVATHSGSATVNIQPGTNPTITIVLMPLTGDVPINATLGSFGVTVTPVRDTLAVGDTASLTASLLDANGTPVTGTVDWGSLAPGVATVVSTGPQTARVTATRPGRTTIVATYGGTAGPATIVVAGWYAAPTGSSDGDGSRRPWDLQTALSGGHGKVQPGDTIWLRGGTYAGTFTASLAGTAAAPIVVRQYRGERATIDGGSSRVETVTVDGQWAIYWGFEIMQSGTARWCDSCLGLRPTGVYVRNAANVKFVNLIVHDVGHGAYTENAAHGIEIYGWVIYNGGHENSTRSDGHGIYIKNDGIGWKIARDNVIFDQFGFGIHGYTEVGSGQLKNLLFDGNVLFNNGSVSDYDNPNLALGGTGIADNDTVTGNLMYFSPGVGWKNALIGFQTLLNGAATFRGNNLVGGSDALDVGYWQSLSVSNNTIVGPDRMVDIHDTSTAGWQWTVNWYWRDPQATAWAYQGTGYTLGDWKAATGLGATDRASAGQPAQPQVFVRPNRYEPGRGWVVIYNWSGQAVVLADLTSVVRMGDRYEVRNVQDVFGSPVVSGTYGGGSVGIPMSGVTPPTPIGNSPRAPVRTGPSFDVFLVTSSPPSPP